MTPKEKAKNLYLKFYIPDYCYAKAGMPSDWRKQASKRNALLAVEEIIKATTEDWSHDNYWQQVHTEIENI